MDSNGVSDRALAATGLAAFPIGYYSLHPDASTNFQMIVDWLDGMLAESASSLSANTGVSE